MIINKMFFWIFLLATSAFGKVTINLEDESNSKINIKPGLGGGNVTKNGINYSLDIKISIEEKQYEIGNHSFGNDTAFYEERNKTDTGTALMLTPYILEGNMQEAKEASEVNPRLFLGFRSYSGFLTVNNTSNSSLFFWYFPVLNKNVSESPWIIWLQGGPGGSSLKGLFDEIGPFHYSDGNLRLNNYTWLQNHSLLFIDNPVGTGFSFTGDEGGYATDMATYSEHLHFAVEQFLLMFSELRTAPLYLAGESYAGKFVSALAMKLHLRTDSFPGHINLQGLILGNAYVDPAVISHRPLTYYYNGLLTKEQLDSLDPLVNALEEEIKANRSVSAQENWRNLTKQLYNLTNLTSGYNFLEDGLSNETFKDILKTSEVKQALHVGDINFKSPNYKVNKMLGPDFLSTTKPTIEILLAHYRVLAYCGQLDLMLPCVFLSENYRTWRWNGSEEFLKAPRYPYRFNNKLYGYHKSGGNFTEVVFLGAGHIVPADVPAPAQNLVTQWTHRLLINSRARKTAPPTLAEKVKDIKLLN